jgi:FAD/FMN-containing dehydrogenase
MAIANQVTSELRTLAALTRGPVVGRDADAYDEARLAWNLAADQRPAAVVFPHDETDVAFAVAFARDAGLRVNVQGTGHNAMPLGDMSDTLLIRTSRMNAVEIDAAGRRARVQAGALWQDVVPQASELGLAALHGSSPDVGIAGYSLGGGIGYMARRHGLQTNSVTAIELVTADGELVRADADHDADLFWALRGGGGNFGVVTALEFRLYPAESVYAGMLVFPWERGAEVLSRWADWTHGVPEEITSMARILQLPDLPTIPDFVRGRQLAVINAAFLDDEARGAELLRPLRELGPEMDLFATMPPIGLSKLHGDPEEPVPAMSDTLMLDSVPHSAIETVMEHAGPGSGSSLLAAELRHVGGAAGRASEGHGALAKLDGDYVLFAVGMAATPEMATAVERDSERLVEAMSPYGHGGKYLNFAERRVDTRSAYSTDAYARLREIRATFDPEALFRANHEIA